MPGDRIVFSTSSIRVAACVLLGLAVLSFGCELNDGQGRYALISIGLLSLVASVIPLLVKDYFDPFEPVVLIGLSAFIGCTMRSVFLAYSDSDNYRVRFLIDGMPISEVAANSIWVPLALVLFSVGYILAKKRVAIERLAIIKRRQWSRRRVIALSILLAVASLYATLRMVQITGVDFSDISRLSAKRTIMIDTDAGEVYGRAGYLNWVLDAGKFGALILWAYWMSLTRSAYMSATSRLTYVFILMIPLSISIAWPILSSSRTSLVEILFGMLVITNYLGFRGSRAIRRRKFVRAATLSALVAALVLVVGGVWRQYSHVGEVLDTSAIEVVSSNSVGSGNFLPMERTALIIDRMGEREDWLLGESYLNTLLGPIPRTLWPAKPSMGLGEFVKGDLYGRTVLTNGYPAGLLGEAFINFGFWGLAAVPFLAGIALKTFYNSFNPLLAKNRNATFIYALTLWPIAIQLTDQDFSLLAMNALIAGLSAFILVWIVSKREQMRALVPAR